MAPVASTNDPVTAVPVNATKTADAAHSTAKRYPAPLQLSGILDKYESHETTPVIGREYPTIQIRDLLNAPNSDELLRELAIISEYDLPWGTGSRSLY
jgi:hypothetical protein